MPSREVYVAGPLGFSAPGRHYLDTILLPALQSAGFAPLNPWEDPDAAAMLKAADALAPGVERHRAFERANGAIGERNARLIRACTAVLAVLDGSDVDSGTASEIGYAAAYHRPVVGIRSDLRLAGDNEAAVVNLQVVYFIAESGGRIVASLEDALATLRAVVPERPS
ncbi:MAG TPA: nucleoside 2-deoxyribosyltransferase [Solirubrobacteraceae bacterium]|jgi:nucleoside 2-deoxyribosyltransferase|nr:nucleoside 2-deoxyribosyltransferase [Solirubrobacteraceae bacterium]